MSATSRPTTPGPARRTALVLLAVAAVVALWVLPVGEWIETVKATIRDLGPLGIGLYVAVYVVATVFFVPGSALTLFAGVQWHVLGGALVVSLASTLGAAAAFLVGRYLARDWVSARVADNRTFAAIDRVVRRRGFRIVLLTRLSPVLPFNLLNYAYGVTGVSFKNFILASWLGMIPGTILYVYLGYAAAEAATGGGDTALHWLEIGVGLLVAISVAVYVGRLARRELDREVEPADALSPGDAT